MDTPNERLLKAAKSGNTARIAGAIAAGADINARTPDGGMTALMIAADQGHRKAVGRLISHGADINAADNAGKTALHHGLFYEDILDDLVSRGADKEAADKYGRTPLLEATRLEYLVAGERLCAHGANANAVDIDGNSALHFAAEVDGGSETDILLAHGADPLAVNKAGAMPINLATPTSGCGEALAEATREAGWPVGHRAKPPRGEGLQGKLDRRFLEAVAAGELTEAASMLEHGADINAVDPISGQTALAAALSSGARQGEFSARWLAERGAAETPAASPEEAATTAAAEEPARPMDGRTHIPKDPAWLMERQSRSNADADDDCSSSAA